MRALLLVSTLALAAFAPVGAQEANTDARLVQLTPDEQVWRSEHTVVDVGVFAGDHLPAETWVAGRPEGLGVDYARLLAGRVGLRLEFHPFNDWEAVTFGTPGQRAPYDLLVGQIVTEEGKARFDFLRPYGAGQLMLVARKGDLQIRGPNDLQRARIAVERPFRTLGARLTARFPEATLVFADDGRQAMDMVVAGQADAYIGTTPSRTQMLMRQRKADDLSMLEALDLPPVEVSLAVPHDHAMLLQLLRKAEATVTPAELARLRSRWGVQDSPTAPAPLATGLTTPERAWLASLRPLRLGFEMDRHPYTFTDASGKFDGLAADYVNLLQKELGLRIELVPARDWNSLQRMVRAREVDMVAAAMPDDFSSEDMQFSRPYEHFPEVIVARLHGPLMAGPEDLAGHIVAAREEAGLLPRLRMLLPHSRLLPVGSNDEGLELVASGKADAYIGTLPAIDPLIRDRYAATLRVVGPAGVDQDFTVGINSEYAQLMPLVDRVLGNVTEEQQQRIRSRWLTTEYQYGAPWRWVLAGLLAALAIVAFIAFAYTRLRRAMHAQTLAERKLAEQLNFQQALLETIPYPVFVKDTDGRYLAVNRAYEIMFDCARGDLLGRTLAQSRHVKGVDAETMHAADMDSLKTGESVRRELHVMMTDNTGVSRAVLLWLRSFTRASGDVAGLLGTMVDVSDIREAEERARASEQRLRDTNDSLPGVILRLHINPDGSRVYDHVTGRTDVLFGMTHQEILGGKGRPLDAALLEDQPKVYDSIKQIIDSWSTGSVEFRTCVDGRIHWIRASGGVPRADSQGRLTWSVYCDDVTIEKEQATALAEAMATAEAAVAAKGAFLAMMSHEIRTPMAGALGLIELMAHTPLDREQAHMLSMVQDSAGALLQILDDILDFSRIESGRLELESHPFDLRVLCDGVIGLLASRAQEKGVRLYCTLDWRLAGEYLGDVTRVRQITTNLLSNALKFTDTGHVELRVELLGESAEGQRLRVSVLDTGIGISSDQLSRLFHPFMQAETSTTRRFGGTGLGLIICRRLANMMGGDVRLVSKLGEGTQAIFEFAMPVARALRPQEAIAGKKALLCTRDPMLERELSNTLSALGLNLVGTDVEDLHDFGATDADLFVVDADMVKAGLVPAGIPCIRLVDTLDPRGSYAEQGSVALCGNPLLWRSATDACHAALNFPLPDMARVVAEKTQQRSARILVAEDHAINRAVISRQLERLGYTHTLVDDGEQALAALQRETYDLLLTDCHMPELDGYALTRKVRELEAGGNRHLTIIALSASALPEQIQRCRDAGMDDFLAKPMQLKELDAKLAEYLVTPEHTAPVPVPETKPLDRQLALLMEVFGSMTKVRVILGGLLDASRQDVRDLDKALSAGDVLRQRDLLHRISGSLQLLGHSANDEAAVLKDNAQQRHDLVQRLNALELLIADMDSKDASSSA